MLDIYGLRIFLAAAEEENFSEAARQLNLTQPAVSMQIQSLEKKLGVSLFHRIGRSLKLTESGKALTPMAWDIINRAIRIEEEMQSLKGEVVGHLKIGCSTTTGKYVLPHLAARFRRRFPRVQITIQNNSREAVINDVRDGMVQLAVISAEPTRKELHHRQFFTDYVVLIVATAHPWAQKEQVGLEDLCGADFILHDQESGTRQEVESVLQVVGLQLSNLNVVMEIGNSEAISMAVEENMGAAFVSRTVARRGIELGRLAEVKVSGLSLQREVFIAYNHRRPATRAQTEFWNFVQEPENEAVLELAA